MVNAAPLTAVGFFLLFIQSTIPVVSFLLLFSGLGFGHVTFSKLRSLYSMSMTCLGGSFFIFISLFVLDVSFWSPFMKIPKRILLGLAGAGFLIGVITSAQEYPAAPMGLFFLGVPASFYLLRKTAFAYMSTGDYMRGLSYSLVILGVTVFASWCAWWGSTDQFWDRKTKLEFNEKMECDEFLDSDTIDCLASFLLWFSPFMAAVACVVFGLVCYFMSQALNNTSSSKTLDSTLRMFVMVILCTCLGLWISASVAGAGMSLANVVTMFCFAAIIITGAMLSAVIGKEAITQSVMEVPLMKKLAKVAGSDWLKALFMITCWPMFAIYMAFSSINQFFRVYLPCNTFEHPTEVSNRYVTAVCAKQLSNLAGWNWASVMVKMLWVGVIFFSLQIGIGKATTIFLSWLAGELKSLNAGITFAIFFAVGLGMFLLPPVPGVPVYLTGGIILTSAVEEDLGFPPALAISGVFCFVIKLCAIVCQQKGIGERMGEKASIRKLVGVNSISIRAIKKILEKPGLHTPKVAILVGGPDWPTSVLTGILGLSLFEMLLGSLPVLLLIVPTAMAGGFQLKKAEGGSWEAIGNVTLAVAALVQGGALLAACYYIEQTAANNYDELSNLPDDQEVLKLEEKDNKIAAIREELVNWHSEKFPKWCKINLLMGAFTMTMCCYLFYFKADSCFETFEVSDTIECPAPPPPAPPTPEDGKSPSSTKILLEVNCLDGNVLNVIKPLGYASILLFFVACFHLHLFNNWAKDEVFKYLEITEMNKAEAQKEDDGSIKKAVQTKTWYEMTKLLRDIADGKVPVESIDSL